MQDVEKNTPDIDIDLDLVERYFSGMLDAREADVFDQWVKVSASRQRIVDDLRAFWSSPRERGNAWHLDLDAMWQDLLARVQLAHAKEDMTNRAGAASGRRFALETQPLRIARQRDGVFYRQTLWRRVGYVATGLIIGMLGLVIGGKGRTRHDIIPLLGAVSSHATASGQRATITLPDGSLVTLNVASRLDVPMDYATGHHTVHLTGEALFTVTRHEGLPFTVIAGSTTARVLGTSFTMRYYPTDTTATVAVREGKVMVGHTVVPAANMVEVGPRGASQLRPADASQFGFATGILKINSMPLSRAVIELDRWYAADIRLGDSSLTGVPIEGKFTAGSLSDLADVLELMLNARVVRDGRVLTLYPKGE